MIPTSDWSLLANDSILAMTGILLMDITLVLN